jgi:hypothetical protein
MKTLKLIRYIIFVPVFVVSYFILNLVLTPLLSYVFEMLNLIIDFFYSVPKRGLLDGLFIDTYFIKGLISMISILIGNYVYPNEDKRIPVLINSTISILILIGVIVFFFNSMSIIGDMLTEEELNEVFEGVSKTKIIVEFLGGLTGTGVVGYLSYKNEI